MMYYPLLRSLLFQFEPERAHHIALSGLKRMPKVFFPACQGKPVQTMGLQFPHRIGLAAGLDKNGDYLDALAKLGFAFIELGTVTPRPQPGNPMPRLFRLPKAHALINRMGFNNQGVDALVKNVKTANYQGILGINIGKNKDTPIERAADDYIHCLQKVYALASYITVNISSPNTPNLRKLQHAESFEFLLKQLLEAHQILADQHQRPVPMLVKISPDESDESLKRMAQAALKYQLAGIIATNTTSNHAAVAHLAHGQEVGGLSGRPLAKQATHCLSVLKAEVGQAMTIIGVGGIDSVACAKEKIDAGADLLQVYTGLIYQGPGLVRRLAGI